MKLAALLLVAAAARADLAPGSGQPRWDLAKRFAELYEPNEARLFWQVSGWTAGGANRTSEAACGGAPFVLTRTNASNGNCPLHLSQLNASCTCVVGNESLTANTTTVSAVTFLVRSQAKPPSLANGSVVLNTSMDDVLSVSSIAPFGIPATLRSLWIIGGLDNDDDAPPLEISIGQGFRWGDLSLLYHTERTNLTTVSIQNLNLANASNSEDFFPTTVANLTLRNCDIANFNLPFFRKLGNLETLDLSGNGLREPYERPQIERCVTGLCLLKSLDLSDNFFSTLPSTTVFYSSLSRLDLSNNPITNFTVSSDVFKSISAIESFTVSPPTTPVECSTSTTRVSVQGVDLCVVSDSASNNTSTTTTAAAESNTNSYLLYGSIGGGVLVAILIYIIIRQRRAHSKPPSDGNNSTIGDRTTLARSSFDESFYNTGTANLLNNPIIITRRVQQSDIRFVTCISKGGFGVVYSGVYRRRRRVAIKKIRPEYSTDVKMIETFLHENCLMATLRHPRIVEFIGVAWESPRDLCAITEFMEKGDVRELLLYQRRKAKALVTWENRRKVTVALHVAEALAYLHSLRPSVIHRDLKAKNVLLNANFDAKLSDFGISRERLVDETHMTAAVGTSFWIAPEVLQGRMDYDERADIYSFGVLLCEIDTEDYPCWHEPESLLPEYSAVCPPAVLALAERCLAREPEHRPTAKALVGALAELLE